MKNLIICFVVVVAYTPHTFCQNFEFGQNITGTFSSDGELVDVDNDGDLDFIKLVDYALFQSPLNGFEIWKNDGNGYFTFSASYDDLPNTFFSTGDIDGDGDIDLVIGRDAYFGTGPLRIWKNQGNGTFFYNGQEIGPAISASVVLDDLDGDGDLDIFTGGIRDDPTLSYNMVWFNNGNGFFTDSGQSLGNSETTDVTPVDIDSDGDMDIIASNCCSGSQSNANRIWINDGSGYFTLHPQTFASEWTGKMVAKDMNGDTYPDLVFSAYWGTVCPQYLNDGSGNFTFDQYVSLYSARVISEDINLDGHEDLLLHWFDYNQIRLNDGVGNYTDGFVFPESNVLDYALGDIDDDGDIDAISVTVNNNPNIVWYNQFNTTENLTVSICESDSVFLNNNWTNIAGTYTEFYTNVSGGDSIVITDLSVQPTIDTQLMVIGDTIFCNEIGAIYQWKDCSNGIEVSGATEYFFIPEYSGEFAVQINNGPCYDTSACVFVSVCEVSISESNEIATALVTTENGDAIVPPSEITYQWINCTSNAVVPESNSQSFEPSTTSEYAVSISSDQCNIISDCYSLNVTPCADELSTQNFVIYPNPNNGLVKLKKYFCGILDIKVYDFSGKLVYEQSGLDSKNIEFELLVAKGVYSVVFYSGSEQVQHRLVMM